MGKIILDAYNVHYYDNDYHKLICMDYCVLVHWSNNSWNVIFMCSNLIVRRKMFYAHIVHILLREYFGSFNNS